MTIILDEIICQNNNVNKRILESIEKCLVFNNRKITRQKTKEYLDFINENNLWHYVQIELIFFKGSIDNCCFFNHSIDNVKKFVKNIEYIFLGEYSKIENMNIDYKKLMRIYEETDEYALVWSQKKQSILKSLVPVKKHIKKLDMSIYK